MQHAEAHRRRAFEKVAVFVLAAREDRDVGAWLAQALKKCLRPPLGLGGVLASVVPESLPKGENYRAWLDSIAAEHSWLVIVASPSAADSRLIRSVLLRWWKVHGTDRVLLVLCGGQLAWDQAASGFDWRRSNALPRTLAERRDGSALEVDDLFESEPAWLDLGEHLEDLSSSLAEPAVRDRIHSVIARIRGLELDALRREHAARRNRLLAILGVLSAGLLMLGIQRYLSVSERSDALSDDLELSSDQLERERRGLEEDASLRVQAEQEVEATRARVDSVRREVVRLDRGAELARDLAQYELVHGRLQLARNEFVAKGWSSARNPFTEVRREFVEVLGSALPVDLSLWEIKRDRIALLTMFMASSGTNTARRVSDDGLYAVGGHGRRRWRVDLLRGEFVRGSSDVDLLAEVGRSLHPATISRGSFGLSDEQVAEFEARELPSSARDQLPPLRPGSQGIAVTDLLWTERTLYAATQEPGRNGLAFDLETGELVDEPYLSSDLLLAFGDTVFSAGFSGSKLYRRDRSSWRQMDLGSEEARTDAELVGDGHLLRFGNGVTIELLTGVRLGDAEQSGAPPSTGFVSTQGGHGLWSLDAEGRPVSQGLGRLEAARSALDSVRASALAPTPDGTWLCTGDLEGRMRLIDLSKGTVEELAHLEGEIVELSIWPANDRASVLLESEEGPKVLVVDLNSGERQTIEWANGAPLRRVFLSRDGRQVLAEFDDELSAPQVRSLASGNQAVDLAGAVAAGIRCARFTEDGTHVLLGLETGGVELWDTDVGQRAWSLDLALDGPLAQILTAPDEDLIVLVQERPSQLHVIDLWDLKRDRTYVSRSTNPYVFDAADPPSLEVFAELAYRQVRLQNFDLAQIMADRAVEEGALEANLVLAWVSLERGDLDAARMQLEQARPALSDSRLAVADWLSLLLQTER